MGLQGIIAGESAITTVGTGSGLNHRGYNIKDLVKYNTCFEEQVHLLLVGELPTEDNLNKLKRQISASRQIPEKLKTVLELMDKDTHPMVVLRTACSFLGVLEPENEKNG